MKSARFVKYLTECIVRHPNIPEYTMRKTILLILIIVISIVMVYGMVFYFGVLGFSFAWILNFMLMMCALTFTEVLNSKLSSHYYDEKGWERKGKIYEVLGIHLYRNLLVFVGWEKLNKKANPVKTILKLCAI